MFYRSERRVAVGNAKENRWRKGGAGKICSRHIIVLQKGALDAYKDKLKMEDKKKALHFRAGWIRKKLSTSTSGAYTEEKMDEIWRQK